MTVGGGKKDSGTCCQGGAPGAEGNEGEKERPMKRKLALVSLALACLLLAPSPAQAGYRDGMSLYEYVGSYPLGYLDPLGLGIGAMLRDGFVAVTGGARVTAFDRAGRTVGEHGAAVTGGACEVIAKPAAYIAVGVVDVGRNLYGLGAYVAGDKETWVNMKDYGQYGPPGIFEQADEDYDLMRKAGVSIAPAALFSTVSVGTEILKGFPGGQLGQAVVVATVEKKCTTNVSEAIGRTFGQAMLFYAAMNSYENLLGANQGLIGRATISGRAGITETLSGLKAGRSPGVKVVGSEAELDALYGRLSGGGRSATPPTYKGTMVELPNGTRVGLRNVSTSGGKTIDIFLPDGKYTRVHIE
jgi:hypothetical protein